MADMRYGHTLEQEIADLRGQLAWYEGQFNLGSLIGYCNRKGGISVHKYWRNGMLFQGREVISERMKWETLNEKDRDLDVGISFGVIMEFVEYLKGVQGGQRKDNPVVTE